MQDVIRVLLADDTLIAREGCRSILETADDIEVVGEALVIESLVPEIQRLNPDVVLLDLKWKSDRQAGLRELVRLANECPATRVVALSGFEDLLAQARLFGASAAIEKTFSKDELFSVIRAVCSVAPGDQPLALRLQLDAKDYADQLVGLPPGLEDARKFEHLMQDVLPFLFSAHLTNFEFQRRHDEGEEHWDGIAFNGSDHAFWRSVRETHSTSQVLFEFKNVKTLKNDHVRQVMGYLDDCLLSFGVLIARNPPSTGPLRAARRRMARRFDLIVIVSDEDIVEMLRIRAEGGDPSNSMLMIYNDQVR